MNSEYGAVPPRPRNKALVPLAICGCLLLGLIVAVALVVGLAGTAIRAGSETFKQAGVGAEQFLTTLEKPDNQAAFDLLTADTRRGKTAESIADTMDTLAKQHGHPVSHRQLQQYIMNTNNGVSSVTLAYQETFEKGEMPVKITMVSENGQWHVGNFEFNP